MESSADLVNKTDELQNFVKNELNKYVDLMIDNVKDLRKEYKHLEFTDKIDKMFAVFYIDKIPDYKTFIDCIYNKYFNEYKNAHLSLLSTLEDVDTHIETIQALIEIGAPESEYSSSESLSDKRSNHRRKK
jgi:hypothetical protein